MSDEYEEPRHLSYEEWALALSGALSGAAMDIENTFKEVPPKLARRLKQIRAYEVGFRKYREAKS